MSVAYISAVRAGVRIEVDAVLWMVVEAAVSISAGIAAGSRLLTAFGLDSVIELVSGGILLWRLWIDAQAALVRGSSGPSAGRPGSSPPP